MCKTGGEMPPSENVWFAYESALSSVKGYRNSFFNIQQMRNETLLCATFLTTW